MRFLNKILLPTLVSISIFSCKKDTDPILTISSGSERIQLNGLSENEQPNASPSKSVYLDLSTEKSTSVLRSSWDIGLYTGADFRAILNITAVAGAKVTDKYDLNLVSATDTIGLSLTTSQFTPETSQLAFFDKIDGDLTQTVIPAVSSIESQNPVIIVNRGTGGNIAPRPWIKMRIYSIKQTSAIETAFDLSEASLRAQINNNNEVTKRRELKDTDLE